MAHTRRHGWRVQSGSVLTRTSAREASPVSALCLCFSFGSFHLPRRSAKKRVPRQQTIRLLVWRKRFTLSFVCKPGRSCVCVCFNHALVIQPSTFDFGAMRRKTSRRGFAARLLHVASP